jgi:hypothetical protein
VIFGYLVVAELAEAAARTGEVAQVQAALDWLSERTRVTPTAWVLGIEARIRALLSDGPAADGFYRESVERLGRTRVRAELARSHSPLGAVTRLCGPAVWPQGATHINQNGADPGHPVNSTRHRACPVDLVTKPPHTAAISGASATVASRT